MIDPASPLAPSIQYAQHLEEHLGADSWQHSHLDGISSVFFEGQEVSEDDIRLPTGFTLHEIVEYDDGTLVRTKHP